MPHTEATLRRRPSDIADAVALMKAPAPKLAPRELLRLGDKLLVTMPMLAGDVQQLADVPEATRPRELVRVIVSAMAQQTVHLHAQNLTDGDLQGEHVLHEAQSGIAPNDFGTVRACRGHVRLPYQQMSTFAARERWRGSATTKRIHSWGLSCCIDGFF